MFSTAAGVMRRSARRLAITIRISETRSEERPVPLHVGLADADGRAVEQAGQEAPVVHVDLGTQLARGVAEDAARGRPAGSPRGCRPGAGRACADTVASARRSAGARWRRDGRRGRRCGRGHGGSTARAPRAVGSGSFGRTPWGWRPPSRLRGRSRSSYPSGGGAGLRTNGVRSRHRRSAWRWMRSTVRSVTRGWRTQSRRRGRRASTARRRPTCVASRTRAVVRPARPCATTTRSPGAREGELVGVVGPGLQERRDVEHLGRARPDGPVGAVVEVVEEVAVRLAEGVVGPRRPRTRAARRSSWQNHQLTGLNTWPSTRRLVRTCDATGGERDASVARASVRASAGPGRRRRRSGRCRGSS